VTNSWKECGLLQFRWEDYIRDSIGATAQVAEKLIFNAGKVVSTVCHGAELFKSAVDAQGVPLVKGKVGKGCDVPTIA